MKQLFWQFFVEIMQKSMESTMDDHTGAGFLPLCSRIIHGYSDMMMARVGWEFMNIDTMNQGDFN